MIAAVVWGYKMTPASVPCVALDYTVDDADERLYLTEAELTALLRAEDLYPVGKQLNRVSLHRMEQTILHHPMVRTAECYLTPRNEVRVHLTQRVPLLRVQTKNEAYFIDTDRRVMQARAAVRDSVMVATGMVGVQMATTQLADFAEWLQENRYWRTRVHHIYVETPGKVYLYLNGEQFPRALMGYISGYERKLAKLRTFIEKGTEATQDKHYTELDLRFKGQVIGRY